MVPNEGTADRVIRGAVAVTAVGAGTAMGGVFTPPGVALYTVAVVAAATAVTGYCPAYSLLGISTRSAVEQ